MSRKAMKRTRTGARVPNDRAGLSYLGLGIRPPTPSWGNMLTGAQEYVFTTPALAVYPGVLILLTVLAFNVLGDGLRDAFEP